MAIKRLELGAEAERRTSDEVMDQLEKQGIGITVFDDGESDCAWFVDDKEKVVAKYRIHPDGSREKVTIVP